MTTPAHAPVLQTNKLSVSFGGVHALREFDLKVSAGRLVGLIGPNGAGKTTCIDGLTGFVRTTGDIIFDGQNIAGWPAHKRAKAGMVRTWQSIEIFTDLTVGENLLVGADGSGVRQVLGDLVAPGRKSAPTTVHQTLERFGLSHHVDRLPAEISHGERKLVGVARALAANPKIVLMDEPAAGLDSTESMELGKHLRAVVEDGTALLLIDHDMGLVLSVCDYLYVLDAGRLIAEGTPAEIRKNERVLAAYLGEDSSGELGGSTETGNEIGATS